MARPRKILNDAKSKVIEDNILKQDPDGLPETVQLKKIAPVTEMPKMETIIFRNDRDPGVALMFHYHSKTHYLHHYTLYHGKEYTLPVEVIEHLENRAIPIYAYKPGPEGHPEMYVNGYKHQFTCKPVRKVA